MGPHASLIELLRARADETPDRIGYTFLADGEIEQAPLTYGRLDAIAGTIATRLHDAGVRPGDRVLLLYPPGIGFIGGFFGTLYAGAVAVPCYPPHPAQLARSLPRILGILADATPAVVLGPPEVCAMRERSVRLAPPLGDIPWLSDDGTTDGRRDPVGATATTLAFLQYTSGSTAIPRGVMVSHGNLLHNLAAADAIEHNDAASVSVSWLPVIHDMGLIEGVLEPLYAGYPAFLMSPAAFLQRPLRWLQAIHRYRATNAGAPNFAYDLCTRRVTDAQRDALDLSSWRVAYNGAEPVRAGTLRAFHERFAPAGFRWRAFHPVYGLAEATLVVTGVQRDTPTLLRVDAARLAGGRIAVVGPEATGTRAHDCELASCGAPAAGVTVVIVDPDRRRSLPDGAIGEIWVASPSVAGGYWGRDDATAEVFHATLADRPGRFLRTGDLGSLVDGALVVHGRIKDLLIVRGMKHYPQDLEQTAEQHHPALRPGCVAAFHCGNVPDGDASVGMVAELDPRAIVAPAELAASLRRIIGETHGLALAVVAILPPGALPKTTSGKLRRGACASGLADGTLATLHLSRADAMPDLPALAGAGA